MICLDHVAEDKLHTSTEYYGAYSCSPSPQALLREAFSYYFIEQVKKPQLKGLTGNQKKGKLYSHI